MLLPAWLNLDSLSIIRLAALLLSVAIAIHLFLVPKKTLATVFLAVVFCGMSVFNCASFFEFAGPFYWQPRTLKTVLVLLGSDIGMSLAMIFLILFTYNFPQFRRVERREFRFVVALSIFLNAGVLALNIYDHFVLQWRFSDTRLWDVYWTALYCSLGVQGLGAIALLIRKAARLSGRGPGGVLQRIIRPRGRDAESARALALIILLPIVAIGASIGMTYSAIPVPVATYVIWLGLLLFYLCFVVAYMNYSADPMTLQMKLLGITLVLILSTMGLVAVFVGETSAQDFPRTSLPPEHSTIRFMPNVSGSYEIRSVQRSFDADIGPRIDAAYGRPWVERLQFSFPFSAGAYGTIHVLNGPLVYLGERAPENGWGGYNPQPAIAAVIMNLEPSRGGGIHVKSLRDSVTITWFRLPELGASNSNTIQLVLRADGTFDMSFEELSPAYGPSIEQLYNYTAASTTGGDPAPGGKPAPFPPRLTGIHPGGRAAPLEEISFTRDLPWSGTRPAVIFESYEAAFARHLTGRVGVLVMLTLAASLIVLLLLPLLLRTSLFTPLRVLSEGMRRVEAGDLATAVKAQSRDEIGLLASSFNRMVESIRGAEASFRGLADDAQDGIIVYSDDAAVYANRRAVEMTGRSVAELERVRFEDVFPPVPLPPFGVQPAPAEAFASRPSGARLPVELVFSRTLWNGRTALAVLARDITRRKREEEETHARQQQLVRMEKLTSLGVLAAGLAHEINVPNHVILSNATVLATASPQLAALFEEAADGTGGHLVAGLDPAELRERWPQMLSAIVRSSTLIDGIIRNLRDFSADSPGRGASLFDVNAAIASAVELVAAYIRRTTDRFCLDLGSGLPRVRGSAQRLEQVFINLILNACQSLEARDRAVTVSSRAGGTNGTVTVVVSDEGVGIPDDLLPRVLDMFFTTREASGGTGLGLYVSNAIVSALGGTLELSSHVGVGTRATVTLPAAALPEEAGG